MVHDFSNVTLPPNFIDYHWYFFVICRIMKTHLVVPGSRQVSTSKIFCFKIMRASLSNFFIRARYLSRILSSLGKLFLNSIFLSRKSWTAPGISKPMRLNASPEEDRQLSDSIENQHRIFFHKFEWCNMGYFNTYTILITYFRNIDKQIHNFFFFDAAIIWTKGPIKCTENTPLGQISILRKEQ